MIFILFYLDELSNKLFNQNIYSLIYYDNSLFIEGDLNLTLLEQIPLGLHPSFYELLKKFKLNNIIPVSYIVAPYSFKN